MTEQLHDLATDPKDRMIAFDRAEFEQSIMARFEKVVVGHALQVAISGNGEQWTYEELDRRTNQVARAILERTVPGRGCVAYLVDHSPNMVICALAALKAAKAFLCIHPGMPPTAQRDIINDAAPDLLLTDASHEMAAYGLAGDGRSVLLLEEIDTRYREDALRLTIAPGEPAAIFYTSGSTGRPKGVVKSHRTVLHRAWLCAQYDSVDCTDRQSLLTYCSFASSEADVFGALLNGATLELYDVASRGLADLGAWIDERRITLLHPPVMLFRRYLSTLRGAGLHPSVRLLALAGETVIASDLQQWRQRFATSCALRHRFSSTEAGHIAVASVAPGVTLASGTVPAPRPVADKHLSVVDEQGRAVEDGEAGELIVRSAFLADYWRRAPEVSDHFQADPELPHQRLFHTGDMGRFLSDGSFEFLGRRDSQVKVRGYRVETQEIEHAFLALPAVKEAAVIAEFRQEENSLVAFVAMKQGALFQAEGLRSELRSILPQWKIPAQIHAIGSLPLTPTGKIDRQLLRQHLHAEPAKSSQAAQPSDTEADLPTAQLTKIWEELLCRTGIQPDDDFFDLGGHSMLAAQLMLRIKDVFNRSLPLKILLTDSTIRRLAMSLSQPADAAKKYPEGSTPVAMLKQGGGRVPLFCVPSAPGSALGYLQLARLLDDDQPVYAVQFDGDGEDDVGKSFEQIAGRCVEHVRQLRPHGPYRICGYSFGGGLAYEMARQLIAAGELVDLLAIFDGRLPKSRRFLRFPRSLPLHRSVPLYLRQFATLGSREAGKYVEWRLRNRLRYRLHLLRYRLCRAERPSSVAARLHAYHVYRPLPYPGVMTLFRASIEPNWIELTVSPQPFNGWDALCDQIQVHTIPGDHVSIMQEPNLSMLADVLMDCLRHGAGADQVQATT
ncbi:non-ribosomal peptide synthetase [Mesorhizobium sp. STM 4661]|uniref:AMP-binding protein n=1 Tax=Mesorhizobium sp. STM 4661 TaxID=1297570 RepID=UPI0002BD7F5D|nr:non-ribosomal peptide synthetase [Mesorhizobium sp. STM 4661]CCV10741.1 putative Phenylalanine racemase (ATP-hydrolyzing) [Mesorhizobium sp. STM 4661]